jgi:Escherichia/Staphylococcus phage prohead protease
MSAAVERRFTLLPVELRAGGSSPKIGGYAAVFNSISQNLGGFVEVVRPSFFNRSHSRGWPDVMARYNHSDDMLLGTTAAGTLRLAIDDVGLSYDVDPPRSRSDVVELVQRGDVRKSSFAFIASEDDWTMSEDQNYPQRSLLNGSLVDVAPVNSPAYGSTTAGLRSMEPAEVRRLCLGPEAAYASLAAKMSAEMDDVKSLAAANELRRFFIRTDGPAVPVKPKPRAFGPAAAAALLARREDPWG